MSTTTDPSYPDGEHGQQSGAVQGSLGTPRREQGATGHHQRPRTQRSVTAQSKPSAPAYQSQGHQNPSAAQKTDQENVLSGEGNESQDSSQPQGTTKHPKRRNKNATPHRKTDRTPSTIPALDGTVSPAQQPASRTPSAQIPLGTPIRQAYAGPTFHASPAASALPMPKFLSRSMPSAPQPSEMRARLDDEFETSDSQTQNAEEESTDSQTQRPKVRRDESPLDIFFNAHRAEQARQSSSEGLASMGMRSQQSLTPASAERAAHTSRYHHTNRPSSGGHSDKAMFMMELDGTGDIEVSEDGRPPSVPFRERLGAARNASGLSQAHTNFDSDEEDRLAKSKALKKLLMSQQNADTQDSHSVGAYQAPLHARPLHRSEAQVQPPQELPSSPAPSREPLGQTQPSSDIKAMENNLRRILKLDS